MDAVFVAIGDDVLCQRRPHACDVGQQRRRGGGQLHAHGVYAVLHHAGQLPIQLGWLHVVLILTHADGARLDFNQLRQRILKPPGDGHRAAQRDVVLGKFLCAQLRCGIDRRAGLADDGVADVFQPRLLQQRGDEGLGFPGSRAVADGYGSHAIAANHVADDAARLGHFALHVGQREIGHARLQHLAVRVHHRQLAARAEAGIHAQRDVALHRRLHQQVVEIFAEERDGRL